MSAEALLDMGWTHLMPLPPLEAQAPQDSPCKRAMDWQEQQAEGCSMAPSFRNSSQGNASALVRANRE